MSTTQAIPADHKFSVEFIGTSGVVAKYVINSQDEPTAYQWASKQKDILKTSQKSADFKKWRIKVTEILEEKKEESKPAESVEPKKAEKKEKSDKKEPKKTKRHVESKGQKLKITI